MSGLKIDARNTHRDMKCFSLWAQRLHEGGEIAQTAIRRLPGLFQACLGEGPISHRGEVLRICLIGLVQREATDSEASTRDLCSRACVSKRNYAILLGHGIRSELRSASEFGAKFREGSWAGITKRDPIPLFCNVRTSACDTTCKQIPLHQN